MCCICNEWLNDYWRNREENNKMKKKEGGAVKWNSNANEMGAFFYFLFLNLLLICFFPLKIKNCKQCKVFLSPVAPPSQSHKRSDTCQFSYSLLNANNLHFFCVECDQPAYVSKNHSFFFFLFYFNFCFCFSLFLRFSLTKPKKAETPPVGFT